MENKTCTKCLKNLPMEKFAFKNMAKGYRSSVCRECQSIMSKSHYYENADKYRKSAIERGKKNKGAVYQKMMEYLSLHPCVDCGETDLVVLEFDHVKPDKKRNVFAMVHGRYKWDTVLKEISKCEVRCANCHRRITAKRSGKWRKSNYTPLA